MWIFAPTCVDSITRIYADTDTQILMYTLAYGKVQVYLGTILNCYRMNWMKTSWCGPEDYFQLWTNPQPQTPCPPSANSTMMREPQVNPQLRHHGQHHSASISRREAVGGPSAPGAAECAPGSPSEACSDTLKRTKSASSSSATQRPPAPYLSTSSVKKTTFKPVMIAGGPTIPKVPPFRRYTCLLLFHQHS